MRGSQLLALGGVPVVDSTQVDHSAQYLLYDSSTNSEPHFKLQTFSKTLDNIIKNVNQHLHFCLLVSVAGLACLR